MEKPTKVNLIERQPEEGGIDVERIVSNSLSTVEEVLCCICHKVLLNPVCCSACETHFCQSCINSWKKKKMECPYHCKLVEKKASKVVNSILSKLNVKCAFAENGCNKVDLYESLLKHENSCQYMKATCKFCNKIVDSKQKHQQECIDYLKYELQLLKAEKEERVYGTGSITNRIIGSGKIELNKKCQLTKTALPQESELLRRQWKRDLNIHHYSSDDEEKHPNARSDINEYNKPINIKRINLNLLNAELDNNDGEILNSIKPEDNNSESNERFKDIISKFKDWLSQNNVNLNRIEIIYNNNEYTLFAKQNINSGEEIVSIPRKLLICPQNVNVPEKIDVNEIVRTCNMKESLILLTLFLLQERVAMQKQENLQHKNSEWSPYLEMLPDDYFSKGMFFDDYEVHWLRGSMLFEETRGKREDVKKFFNAVTDSIDCTFDDFCWSFSNANSKMVTVKIKNLFSSFLVPLVNCLEIDIPHNNQTKLEYDSANDCLVLKAQKRILKNRRIFLSIENISNHQLLLNHGVIFDNNPDDEVEINMFFNDFDPLINIRRAILRNSDEPFIFKLKNNFSIENIGLFLAFLRIVEASNKEELKHDLDYYINNCVNLNNEKKVMKKLEIIFKSRLNNYDTKCDQDEKLLKSDLLTANQKNCLMIRVSEKKIVSNFINFSSTIQKLLDKRIFFKEVAKNPAMKTYLKTIESLKL